MNKLYDRIYWHNDTNPALNESNLNSMSKAIDDIDDRVIQIADEVVDNIADIEQWHTDCYNYKETALQAVSDAQGYATDASDYATASSNYATASSNSATNSENSALDSEAWAVGQRNGTDVESTDPAYQNNAKYYAEQAGEDSEAWAVGQRGGVDVPITDDTYHNNAKWYSRQANASALDAQQSVSDCEDIKDEVIDMIGGTSFSVDFATGELVYTNNSTFNFSINQTTGNLEWEVVA